MRRIWPFVFLRPQGGRGVARLGHRAYVGGLWEEIGRLQFDFLLSKGLRPASYLIDIACGSLRLGVKVIPFLEAGHYLGLEKEPALVKAGIEQELDPAIRFEKQPRIAISDSFEFEKLGEVADFAIAQSLFTHLPPPLIETCLSKLHPWLNDDGVLYATFFRSPKKVANPKRPHDHGHFAYTESEMLGFGESLGYTVTYIGDWGHPRNQVMVEYRKRGRHAIPA